MENKYTNLREVTPQEMQCSPVGACPSIYEGLKKLTFLEMCGVGACPSGYEAKIEGREVYLIIGKQIKASEVGLGELEKKIGFGEVLIEVPKELIDNKQ